MTSRLICTMLLSCLLQGVLIESASARSYISPKNQVAGYGYKADQASLIGYLREGLPLEPEKETYAQTRGGPLVTLFERWKLYAVSAQALTGPLSTEGRNVLVRLLEDPLPARIEEDLFLYTVGGRLSGSDFPALDKTYTRQKYELQSHCAAALARLDGETSRAFVLELAVEIEAAYENSSNRYLKGPLVRVCDALRGINDLTGVDILINSLSYLPIDEQNSMVRHLNTFEDAVPRPPWLWKNEETLNAVQAWQEWWKAERDHYDFVPRPTIDTHPDPQEVARSNTSIHEAIVHFSKGHYSTQQAVSVYLEQHGPERLEEFQWIVKNPALRKTIRVAAIQWYAKLAGDEGFDFVLETLVNPNEEDPPFNAMGYMRSYTAMLFPIIYAEKRAELVDGLVREVHPRNQYHPKLTKWLLGDERYCDFVCCGIKIEVQQ